MATQRTVHRLTHAMTTTDASATTLIAFAVPQNTVVMAESSVIGKDASNNVVVAKKTAIVNRSTGSASLVSGVQTLIATLLSLGLAGTTVTMDVSGNDVRVRVQGLLATTIEWFVELTV